MLPVPWADRSAPAPKELSTAKLPQVVRELDGNNIKRGVELMAVEPRGRLDERDLHSHSLGIEVLRTVCNNRTNI